MSSGGLGAEVVRLHDSESESFSKIAARLGRTRDQVARLYTVAKGGGGRQKPQLDEVLDVPVRPFQTKIQRGAKRTKPKGKWRKALIVPDTHKPFTDPLAEACVLQLARDLRAEGHLDRIIHLGDLIDAPQISTFDSSPDRINTLQDDIDGGRQLLWSLSEIAPDIPKDLLEGNHCDRLRRTIWSLQGPHRELARLREFQRLLSWPNLFGLGEIGWDFTPYADQPRVDLIPLNAVMHGYKVNKHSGGTARLEHEQYHMSGISGHTHRLGSYFKNDIKGSHNWVECGHIAGAMDYAQKHANHQQGCVVTTYNEAGDWFRHELIFIQRGRMVYGEQEYRAA